MLVISSLHKYQSSHSSYHGYHYNYTRMMFLSRNTLCVRFVTGWEYRVRGTGARQGKRWSTAWRRLPAGWSRHPSGAWSSRRRQTWLRRVPCGCARGAVRCSRRWSSIRASRRLRSTCGPCRRRTCTRRISSPSLWAHKDTKRGQNGRHRDAPKKKKHQWMRKGMRACNS